jgi:hypothetical protein
VFVSISLRAKESQKTKNKKERSFGAENLFGQKRSIHQQYLSLYGFDDIERVNPLTFLC